MVYRILLVLALTFPLLGFTQISELVTLKSVALRTRIENLPIACDLNELIWENKPNTRLKTGIEGKVHIRFYGNISDPIHRENLLQLQKLQERFVESRVYYIHHFNEGLDYKQEALKLKNLFASLKISLPYALSSFNSLNCLPLTDGSTTEIIGPEGQVLERFEGLLNPEYLNNGVSEIQHRLIDLYKLNRSPYTDHILLNGAVSQLLRFPYSIACDPIRELLFISDLASNRIVILEKTGSLHAIVGSGSPGHENGQFGEARLNAPHSLAYVEASNELYFSDSRNNRIRAVNMDSLTVRDVIGNGNRANTTNQKLIETHDALSFPTCMSTIGSSIYFQCIEGIYLLDTKTQVAELIVESNPRTSQSFASIIAIDSERFAAIHPDANQPTIFIQAVGIDALSIPPARYGNADGKGLKVRFGPLNYGALSGELIYLIDANNELIRNWEFRRDRVIGSIAWPQPTNQPNGQLKPRNITGLCQMDEYMYACDPINGHLLRYDKNKLLWQAMPITGYEELCYGYFPEMNPISDSDTVRLHRDNPTLTIALGIQEGWHIDKSGIAIAEVQSRNFNVSIALEVWDEGKIYVNVGPDASVQSGTFTLDLVYYVQSDNNPELQYRLSETTVIPVVIDDNTNELEPLQLEGVKL